MAQFKDPGVSFTVVEGRGEFPIDMLRYEQCWPALESQAGLFATGDLKTRWLVLAKRSGSQWNAARWESFGWRVVKYDFNLREAQVYAEQSALQQEEKIQEAVAVKELYAAEDIAAREYRRRSGKKDQS